MGLSALEKSRQARWGCRRTVQYAKIAGATVAAVDVIDAKLEMAKQLGAAYTFNGSTSDPVQAIQELGGADVAIVLAATPKAYEQAFASLRPNGTLVAVGLPADNIMRLPIFETVLRGIKVVGSLVGTRVDLAETFEIHADGRTRIVRESRRLDDVNDAMREVEKGEVEARLVSTSAPERRLGPSKTGSHSPLLP